MLHDEYDDEYDEYDDEREYCWGYFMYLCKDPRGNVFIQELEMRGFDYPNEVTAEARYGLRHVSVLVRLRLRRLAKKLPVGEILDISGLREEPQIIRISPRKLPPLYC
ncbi:MAG: hypothetical protein BroJett038_12370 [Chloroflexota bacterium]|nr:MAG: hypothetical protein BroJett038_12370 [Chloroflexota bacterium]